eukprot:323801-Chlamydomonas_euryale.AAC.7
MQQCGGSITAAARAHSATAPAAAPDSYGCATLGGAHGPFGGWRKEEDVPSNAKLHGKQGAAHIGGCMHACMPWPWQRSC